MRALVIVLAAVALAASTLWSPPLGGAVQTFVAAVVGLHMLTSR